MCSPYRELWQSLDIVQLNVCHCRCHVQVPTATLWYSMSENSRATMTAAFTSNDGVTISAMVISDDQSAWISAHLAHLQVLLERHRASPPSTPSPIRIGSSLADLQ